MGSCIFCDILDGSAEASSFCRDEPVSAFMDTKPFDTGHALAVPNEHHAFLSALPRETGGRMFTVGRAVASALRLSGLVCGGMNMFLAAGEHVVQGVFYFHLHVFPRLTGDGFRLRFGPNCHFMRTDRRELDAAAERLGAVIAESA